MSCNGLKSSNNSAILPIRDSTSPWRTTVLWQYPQTAYADCALRKSTGAPQPGHGARYARCGSEVATEK